MDLVTLTALYPLVRELIEKAPQVREWLEKKAKKEDPSLFLQLQLMESLRELRNYMGESIRELRDYTGESIRELRDYTGESIRELRDYTLTASIMSAMLSNPGLSEDEIKEKFIKSAEVAKGIAETIRGITP